MPEVSVIIPARNELFLPQTVADLLAKGGDIEVIAVLDGYWPDPPLPDDKRLVVLHHGNAKGMRACINHAASISRGKYLMKSDGHCMFAEGYDTSLAADCEDNWILVPRRYSLDAEAWVIKPDKPPQDVHYLDCPFTNKDGFQFHGKWWRERSRLTQDEPISETMSWQGSFWFMTRKHWDFLGKMDEASYGTFSQEPQEIGMKTWLGGGKIMLTRKTWGAHLHKGKQYGRGYYIGKSEVAKGHEYSARYWVGNQWAQRVHDFEWFIDRFWEPDGIPTWPEDWRKLLHEYSPDITREVLPA